jgi:hypothetical protein
MFVAVRIALIAAELGIVSRKGASAVPFEGGTAGGKRKKIKNYVKKIIPG